MNVSSMYQSHIDGYSDVDPNAISSKYSIYVLANTGDNGEPIASPSSCNNKDEDNSLKSLNDKKYLKYIVKLLCFFCIEHYDIFSR